MGRDEIPYYVESDGRGGYRVHDSSSPGYFPYGSASIKDSTKCPYYDMDKIKEYQKEVEKKMKFIYDSYAKPRKTLMRIGISVCVVLLIVSRLVYQFGDHESSGTIAGIGILTFIAMFLWSRCFKNPCDDLRYKSSITSSSDYTALELEYWELVKKRRGCIEAINSLRESEKIDRAKNAKTLANEQEIIDRLNRM